MIVWWGHLPKAKHLLCLFAFLTEIKLTRLTRAAHDSLVVAMVQTVFTVVISLCNEEDDHICSILSPIAIGMCASACLFGGLCVSASVCVCVCCLFHSSYPGECLGLSLRVASVFVLCWNCLRYDNWLGCLHFTSIHLRGRERAEWRLISLFDNV